MADLEFAPEIICTILLKNNIIMISFEREDIQEVAAQVHQLPFTHTTVMLSVD